MKILFLRPPFPRTSFVRHIAVCEPLELEILAATVADHHDVALADMRVDSRSLNHHLLVEQPDVVAMTGYTMDVPALNRIAGEIKNVSPKTIVVIGGEHASHLPNDFSDDFDFVFRYNAVETFSALIEKLEQNRSSRGSRLQQYMPRLIEATLGAGDIPDVRPMRGLSGRFQSRYRFGAASPISLVQLTAGCKYRCGYCSIPSRTPKHSTRAIDDALVEIGLAPAKDILTTDANALQNVEYGRELYQALADANLGKRFMISCRTDTISRHPELLPILSAAGVRVIAFGIESFNDSKLRDYHKGNKTSTSLDAVRLCHQHGIMVRGNLIVDQQFDLSDFAQLADDVEEAGIEFPSLSILTPLPGTKFFDESRSRLLTTDYTQFDLSHSVLPTRLPLDVFHNEFRRLFQRLYGPRRLLWLAKKLPVMTTLRTGVSVARAFIQFKYDPSPK